MDWIKKIETEAGLLGIAELEKPLDELLAVFQFSDSEKEKFNQLNFERRKKEFLVVRLVAQELLNKKPEISYDDAGQPVLKNSPLNISISHSHELVTVLISDKKAGIDVENINRAIEKAATRFLSANELKYIKKQENTRAVMILYWSAKEAVFKCSDLQGIHFNQEITIHPVKFGQSELFQADLVKDGKKRFYNCRSFLIKNNVVVYCVEEENKITKE